MAQHVKILGLLHIVLSGLALAGGLAVLLIFGGLAGLVGAVGQSPDNAFAIPILGGIGLLQFKPWARTMMIVVSAFDLLGFPLHTALGAYGLWVLLNRETELLFAPPAFQVNPPAPPRPSS